MHSISVLGSGWLGLPLARQLIARNYQVKLSTTSKGRLAELQDTSAESYLININQPDESLRTFLQADTLIINITSKDVHAFRNLATIIDQSEIQHVLFISSTSVYENGNCIVTEDSGHEIQLNPLFQIENILKACDGFETSVIRFAGLVGGRRHPARFIRPGRPMQYPDAPVNLIHRDDCIEVIVRLIQRGIRGEDFSACADTHPTKREFYTQAAKSLNVEPPVFAESDDQPYKIISNKKIKQALDYQMKYPDLMETLSDRDAFSEGTASSSHS